jgi:S-DNA-T family DNA segregation ATPase FtsK/SpoIIIE
MRTLLSGLLDRRRDRQAMEALERRSLSLRDYYAPIWRQVTEHLPLSHSTHTPTGVTITTPELRSVDIWTGPNPVLVVELLPGQLLTDLQAQADRLAPALGAKFLRMAPRGDRWVRVELMETDPLDIAVQVPAVAHGNAVMIAQTETGQAIRLDWAAAPHAVIQGATRSGKSVWCYSVLAQLVRRSDVLITGSDPSGILLGRPYADTVHYGWQVTGSGNVREHLDLLRRLVAEMDRRITELPERADKLTCSDEVPLMVVVLEEFAGLLRLASTLPTPRGEAKIGDQLRSLFGRLVSEGHKVGIRLLVISQRADATIIGGFERGQLGMRMSFRVTDPEALVMLHPEGRGYFRQHTQAPAGVALLEAPGIPLARVRGPRMTSTADADYAVYWDQIQAVTARLHLTAA